MNVMRMSSLLKRELKDIFRDKKTLFMMVVLPLILYPLLIVIMTLIMNGVMQKQSDRIYQVGFSSDNEIVYQDMLPILEDEEVSGYQLEVELLPTNELSNKLQKEELDAYVCVENNEFKLCYLSAKTDSSTAVNALNDAFEKYLDQLRVAKIENAGLLASEILEPITYKNEDLSSTEESMGNMIGSIIPFMIITSVLLGAIYPAIDVTAGEKERGTLETLLTLPVTNLELIMSKFLTVSIIACISAVLNVFSMGVAVLFLITNTLASASNFNISISYESFIPGVCFTVVVMIFFALLVTAVCMCTCVFAKSFKEANNYITPVMLIFMFGSYVSLLPDLKLTAQTAAIPIVNVALLIKGLFQFQYDYGLFAIVLFSNVAYSFLAVLILSKIYNSEAVLFSEGFHSLKLIDKRSDMKKHQIPGYADMILLFSVVLLLIFYVGTAAQVKFGFGGVAVQQLIILLCPLIYAWYIKVDWKEVFPLRIPRMKHVIGALCMGIAAFLLAMVVGTVLAKILPESTSNLMQLDEWFQTIPVPYLILVVAILPAIGEELLFRGFLFGSLQKHTSKKVACIITILVFAAYHMSIIKMFTIAIIGFVFTYCVWKTKSLWTSILLHFLNNLSSIIITKYPDKIQKLFPVVTKQALEVSDMLIISFIILLCGGVGFYLLSNKKPCK